MSNKIYFFADVDEIDTQTRQEAYGPTLLSEDEKFQVSSFHKGSEESTNNRIDAKAYAICDGLGRFQGDISSNYLHFILYPTQKLIQGIPIKYIIYKNILKSSLINITTGNLLDIDITKQLVSIGNNSPDNLGLCFKSSLSVPAPNEGFEREDSDDIDTIFLENTSIKPLIVKAGQNLGKFDKFSFSIQIVLNNSLYSNTLEIARNIPLSEAFEVSLSSTTESQAINQRERILKYFDPCAFYGCINDKFDVRYFKSGRENKIKNQKDHYLNILDKFYNKNKIYLDIRNENNGSYNLYEELGDQDNLLLNKDNNILKSKKEANTSLDFNTHKATYKTQINGTVSYWSWPIMIFDESEYLFSNKQKSICTRIALKYDSSVPDDKIRHIQYISSYKIYNNKNRIPQFLSKDYYEIPEIDSVEQINKHSTISNFSNELYLASPLININGINKVSCFYHFIVYHCEYRANPISEEKVIATNSHWENLFFIPKKYSKWSFESGQSSTQWFKTGHTKLWVRNSYDFNIYNGIYSGGIAVDFDTTTDDLERITFFAIPDLIIEKKLYYNVRSGANTHGYAKSGTFFTAKEGDDSWLKGSQLYVNKVRQVVDHTQPFGSNELAFISLQQSPVVRSNSKESLYAISITKAELDLINETIEEFELDQENHHVFIQVREITPVAPANDLTRGYTRMLINICGYNFDGERQSIAIPEPSINNPGIALYSLSSDLNIFCTRNAAGFESVNFNPGYSDELCSFVRDSSILNLSQPDYADLNAVVYPYNEVSGHADNAMYNNDISLFRRSKHVIKSISPVFYNKIENLRLFGISRVYHDRPGILTHNNLNPVKVVFSASTPPPSASTWEMEYYLASPLVNVNFPGDPIRSNILIHTGGFTIDSLVQNNFTNYFSSILNSRYALLNSNHNLKQSEVYEELMVNYSNEELRNFTFNVNKLYLESSMNESGVYNTTTLNRIKVNIPILYNLGACSNSPNANCIIQFMRNEIMSESEYYEYNSENLNTSESTIIPIINLSYSPRVTILAKTLIHELGHYEMNMKKPIESYIWSKLESAFNGKVSTESIRATYTSEGITRNRTLTWPPHPIGGIYSTLNLIQNQSDDLESMGFFPRTGGGHLRGHPSGANAAKNEFEFMNKYFPIIKEFQKTETPLSTTEIANYIRTRDFDLSYLYFNLNENDL